MSNSRYPTVLVVGPSASKGGIATVLRVHRSMALWKVARCRLLSTYDERSAISKLMAMLAAYAVAPFLIFRSSLIHIHVAAQRSMWRKLPIALLAKLMGKAYIIHLHAASEKSVFMLTPQWIVRTLFLLSYRVVVLSESWKTIVNAYIPDARVAVIHNSVAGQLPAELDHDSQTGRMVLYAGKLEHRKGYLELLRAASEVVKHFPDVRFCFAGHGEIDQARTEAQRLNIANSVSFLGWLRPDEIGRYYRGASIFCLPSFDEGLPMSVLEAMSFSLPVVCSPVGGLQDLISDGEDGIFVEAGNIHSIARGLMELLSNPERASRIGRNGALTLQRKCGLDHIERDLAHLYEEVHAEWILRRSGIREGVRATICVHHSQTGV